MNLNCEPESGQRFLVVDVRWTDGSDHESLAVASQSIFQQLRQRGITIGNMGRTGKKEKGRKEGSKEGRKEGRKKGRKEGRKKGRKEERKKGRKKGRKEGKKGGR